MSLKYRKRPVVIEAVEYAGGGNIAPRYRGGVPDWLWEALESGVVRATNGTDPMIVSTLEGDMVVNPGDWIIRGVEGELYPCKPSVFEASYELLDD